MSAALASFLKARSGLLARRGFPLFLALGFAFVLLLLGSSHWQPAVSLQALSDLQQQAQRTESLDNLLIEVMDAENAVRGYLLSGNRAHLEPYARSQASVHNTLDEIRRSLDPLADNDAALTDLSRLSGLIAGKLQSLQRAIERGRAGEENSSQGKRDTDQIRDAILGLKTRLAAQGRLSVERSTRHLEYTRWVVATLASGALVLIGALWSLMNRQFNLREQLTRLLESENQRLEALVQERTAELSDLASYLTNAREQEKARLARELHDELGALLMAARMEAEALSREICRQLAAPLGDSCRERLARLEEHLKSGIALKRRIIDDLRPPLLEMLGLISALRALGEEFARAGKEELTLELPDDDLEIAPTPALALFRIAQEALTNIRKHAHASRVKLALRVLENGLELEIADDGRGFDAGQGRRRQHGLAGMKHRVQMCAGEFRLESQPAAGTCIVVRLPAVTPAPSPVDQEGFAYA